MKKDEFNNIKVLDIKSLKAKIWDLKKELVNLKMEKNMKQLKDVTTVAKRKKMLAQVQTVLHQKELLEKLHPAQAVIKADSKQTKQQTKGGKKK